MIIECTGVSSLVFDAMTHVGTGGVVCLTGVSSGGHTITVDEGALNRSMVLENVAVVGRSTPTGATTRPRPMRWPRPTGPGWPAW